jgi:uncharacterized protein GlcG (DUF336 family)
MAANPRITTSARDQMVRAAIDARAALSETIAYAVVDDERAVAALSRADEALSEAIMAAGYLDGSSAVG